MSAINTRFLNLVPLKESHEKYVPGLKPFLISENGARVLIAGRPGSGKSVLVQNLFREEGPLYQKFDNCFLVIPENSFLSVPQHPFKNHDKVYHDLNSITSIMSQLHEIKQKYFEYQEYLKELREWKARQRSRKRKYGKGEGSEDEEDDDPPPPEVEKAKLEYSVLVIDDFGPQLQEKAHKLLIRRLFSRSRHFMCQVYIICQEYLQMDMTCRKMLSHTILFNPSNMAWERFVREQLIEDEKEAHAIRNFVFREPYATLMVDESKHLYMNFQKIQFDQQGNPSVPSTRARNNVPGEHREESQRVQDQK